MVVNKYFAGVRLLLMVCDLNLVATFDDITFKGSVIGRRPWDGALLRDLETQRVRMTDPRGTALTLIGWRRARRLGSQLSIMPRHVRRDPVAFFFIGQALGH